MSIKTLVKSSLVCIILVLSKINVNAQLNAAFSASSTSGCTPMVIQFIDQSTGNPTFWKWDLGNGTISYLQNPSVTYFNPGLYTVKLTIQNANGEDEIIKTNYIVVNGKPAVDFTTSATTGCYPLNVQFTDLTNPVSGTSTQWFWDFGDGITSTNQNPVHVYTTGGNFNVSLYVTNSEGCSNTITRPNYIRITQGVTARFTHSEPTNCQFPVNINFQNTSIGTGNLTYKWDFGDSGSSTEENPSHNYTLPGTYSVSLIVANSSGCKDTLIMPNTVVIGTVNASFNTPANICVNNAFTFNNTSTPIGTDAQWDFGDGTTSNQANPQKAYSTPGNYVVTLISGNTGCSDTSRFTINVLPKPQTTFQATPVQSCRVPVTVTFTNTSAGAINFHWDFGDGTTSSEINPTHQYLSPGLFNVRLISTNASGCSDTLTQEQLIKIELPTVSINNLPQKGCTPFSWTFDASVTSSELVTGYLWNFGDGNTSTEVSPTHIFAQGDYNISLTITTQTGCKDSVVVNNGIQAGDKPVAAFSASPLITCAWQRILFTDLTTDTADAWLWDFGDGGTSVLQNPEYKYRDTGYFTVKLIVWNRGCSDTLEVEDYIYINPPIAKMRIDFSCDIPLTRDFKDKSIGADSWLWNFGDGQTSIEQNPSHTYSSSGNYTITLIVTNNLTGCSDTTKRTIPVINERANFNASDTEVCRNTPVTFTAMGNPTWISDYSWNFGDGHTGTGNPKSNRYTTPGLYTVGLIIKTIDGCQDTLIKPDYIRVNGPTANFGSTVPGSCKMSPIVFSDSSSTDGTHSIVSWTWNYGDGNIETLSLPPFIHQYATHGNYSVSLTVTDTEGCIDSISRSNLITISNPRAAFSSPDSITCPGRTVAFTSRASGPSLQHFWDFGDGNTSTQRNPVHQYGADGDYTISLLVVDLYGCRDSISKPSYIHIVTPQARFTVSDTLSTCPPLVANFTNQSSHFTSLVWDFGDGTNTTQPNPSHFYSTPGVYQATLTLTGPGGCTDTKTQNIVIRGPQGTFTYPQTSGCSPLSITFTATTLDRVSFIWDFNDGNTLHTTDSVVTHTYTIPGYYLPKMILLDAGGCVVPIKGNDTIWVRGVEVDFSQTQTSICDSGTVQFTNLSTGSEPFQSFSWNFGDGHSSSLENPTHTYNTTGIFYPSLQVTTMSGCSKTLVSTQKIKIAPSPQISIIQSPDGCAPLTATLRGHLANPDTSAIQWMWNLGNGQSSILINPPAQDYDTPGSYSVSLTVLNSNGCTDTAVTTINAFAKPQVNAGEDTYVCLGIGKNLQATGAASYSWSPSTGLSCSDCPSPIATPTAPIIYTVTGTSAEGCVGTDDIQIEIQQRMPITVSRGDSLCIGGFTRISAAGAHSYNWYPATGLSNANIANPIASPIASTNYMVVGRDERNCFADTAYAPIRVFPNPTVDAGPNKTINVGQTVDLIPIISSDVTHVTWSPTSGIFRNDYPAITVKPNETTEYTVDVTNAGGCMARGRVIVHVLCNGANVFIPNTFSPNNDGFNDRFYPRGSGLFRVKSAKVFNRWGQIVYEKNDFLPNDVNAGWDGTLNGKTLSPDIYVYIMEIMCDNNTVLPLKGNVALIK